MKDSWRDKSQTDFLERGLGRYIHRQRLKILKQALGDIAADSLPGEPAKVVLDFGCGEGILSREIYNKNLKVIGIDYDIKRITRAAGSLNANVNFLVSDIINPVFKPGSADIIILHHVIEHLEGSDEKMLDICRSILKKDGWFIVGIPNEDSLLGRLSRAMHKKLYAAGEHVNFYSEKSMAEMLGRKGFIIKSVGRVGFLFPFYYVHMILIAIKPIFYLGHWLTQIFRKTADSLILVSKKCEI